MLPQVMNGVEFFLYKITCLLTGLAFCYMGYRLFLAGLLESNTNFEFKLEKIAMKLGKAAPGTCFALFGAMIICGAVWKGYSSEVGTTTDLPSKSDQPASKVDLPEQLPGG
jgi:hypothetical protein